MIFHLIYRINNIYHLLALHSHHGYSSKLHFPESTSYSAIVFVDNYTLHNFVVTIIFCNWCVINWLSVACLFKTAQFILNECCRFTQYHGIEYLYIVWQYLKSNAPTVTVFWYGGLEGLGSFQKIRQNKQIWYLIFLSCMCRPLAVRKIQETNWGMQLKYTQIPIIGSLSCVFLFIDISYFMLEAIWWVIDWY